MSTSAARCTRQQYVFVRDAIPLLRCVSALAAAVARTDDGGCREEHHRSPQAVFDALVALLHAYADMVPKVAGKAGMDALPRDVAVFALW